MTVWRFPSHSEHSWLVCAILAHWHVPGCLSPSSLFGPLLAARLDPNHWVLQNDPSWLLCTLLVYLARSGSSHFPCNPLSFWLLDSSWLPSVLAYLFSAILAILCPAAGFLCAFVALQSLPDSSGPSCLFDVILATQRFSGYLALFSVLGALLIARNPTGSWMSSWLFGAFLAPQSFIGRSATSWPLAFFVAKRSLG